MQEWEKLLPDEYFVRIQRSVMVNFEYVEPVKKCRNYTAFVYIKGIEKPFMMSRQYAVMLKRTRPW